MCDSWRVLRAGVAPGRLGGVQAEPGEGLGGAGDRTAPRLGGAVEGAHAAHHHDRHAHGAPVVHLRRRQGLLPHAAPPAPGDARLAQAQAAAPAARLIP